MEESEKGDAPYTGKSAPTEKEEAGVPNKGRSTGRRKEVEESRGRRGSTCGQAMRNTAKMEEELDKRAKEESGGALQKRSTRGSTVARIGIVYPRDDSDL